MSVLFKTNARTLINFIREELPGKDISRCCSGNAFPKGREYFATGCVEEAAYTGQNQVEIDVEGSQLYTVTLRLSGGGVRGQCNCPSDDYVCKHVVAALLSLQQEESGSEEDQAFRQELKKFTVDELLDLLARFAPAQFCKEIMGKAKPATQAANAKTEQLLKKELGNIDALFEDEELLYEPMEFAECLMSYCTHLKPLWSLYPDQISKTLLGIPPCIEEAFDNGYLYIDNYTQGSQFFKSPEFNEYVIEFARQLDTERKLDFTKKLRERIVATSYGSFNEIQERFYEIFTQVDLPRLKEQLPEIVTLGQMAPYLPAYYLSLYPILSEEEKEEFLLKAEDQRSELKLALARLYIQQHKYEQAEQRLKALSNQEYFDRHLQDEVFREYAGLAQLQQTDPTPIIEKALRKTKSREMLLFAVQALPEEKNYFMQLFKQVNPGSALDYMEELGQLDEAFALLNSHKFDTLRKCEFFEKHAADYPEAAANFFLYMIEENLQYTGDYYYLNIARALKGLKPLNEPVCKAQLDMLRANYKRRSNLMSLLDATFGKA